jgi:hypothetical protein
LLEVIAGAAGGGGGAAEGGGAFFSELRLALVVQTPEGGLPLRGVADESIRKR